MSSTSSSSIEESERVTTTNPEAQDDKSTSTRSSKRGRMSMVTEQDLETELTREKLIAIGDPVVLREIKALLDERIQNVHATNTFDVSYGNWRVSQARVEDRLSELEAAIQRAVDLKLEDRVAPVDYKVADMPLDFDHDLVALDQYINRLFEWHETDKDSYMAPYFPIVQSSGMGKSKLLYEYRQRHKDETVLLLCLYLAPLAQETLPDMYDDRLNVQSLDLAGEKAYVDERTSIYSQLDKLVKENLAKRKENSRKLVLLFDEAQKLLDNDGFVFRCIRWWLRDVQNSTIASDLRIVAVFAGTTSRLSNFYREDTPKRQYSRGSTDESKTNKGTELYGPFHQLCTISVFKNKVQKHKDLQDNDLIRAAKYSRPLLALMITENDFYDRLEKIRRRIVLGEPENSEKGLSLMACLSVLGTRAQMGQTSLKVSSELVARGYANLTYFDTVEKMNVANMCFVSEPVCAYLAMRIMMSLLLTSWAKRAFDIFFKGLCHPDKGDLGEIAVALYLLFCGDVLRMAIPSQKPDEIFFAVPLKEWIQLLKAPKAEWTDTKIKPVTTETSISFIQVCRNYLRHSVKDFVNGGYLREWFEAGLAYYACPNQEAFDIIAPVRYFVEGKPKYCPMLISVKNQVAFPPGKVKPAMDDMEKQLGNMEGICVLVLTGKKSKFRKNPWEEKELQPIHNNIQSFLVVVPENDCFGIWDLSVNTSTAGGRIPEIYSSHPLVYQSAEFTPGRDQQVQGPPQAYWKNLVAKFKSLLRKNKDSKL